METGSISSKNTLRTGAPHFSRDEILSSDTLSEIGHKFGHEVGNPLTAIISLASILGRALPPDKTAIDALLAGEKDVGGQSAELQQLKLLLTRLPEYANSITHEAWRISSLTETLVFLLSERANQGAATELEKSVNRALSKLNSRSRLRKQLFDLRVPAGPPVLRIEQDQFIFLLGELMTNAAQAMADLEIAPERAITIELLPGFESGKAQIVIENPIARSCPFELSSLFKPFVTEYGARKQLGLGLPTVLVILERHDASIEIAELADERGRMYFQARVTIPCAAAGQTDAADESDKRRSRPAPARGSAERPRLSVLVIEDEQSVATAIERILEATMGGRFRIETSVATGNDAIELVGSGRQFDLILCDLNLSGTSGRTIFDTIQRSFPAYADRFMFLTGERNRKEIIRYLESTRRPYLLKPFDAAELEDAVLSLLSTKEVDNGSA